MKTLKAVFVAIFAATTIISCNMDNADSPANTVTQADTTTTDPQGLTFETGVLNPAAMDTAAFDSTTFDSTTVDQTTQMPAR